MYLVSQDKKSLIHFEKVEVKAGKSEEVTISFLKEELASYCYTRDNGDGTKGCYVLEQGDYVLTLGKNSHDAWDSETTHIANTIWYDNSNPRQSEINAQVEGSLSGIRVVKSFANEELEKQKFEKGKGKANKKDSTKDGIKPSCRSLWCSKNRNHQIVYQ